MIRTLALALELALAAAPALAQPSPISPTPRPLTADEHTALRCAAGFAIVTAGQARGDGAMAQYPLLGARGREFFVITAARLMDDAGLDQLAIKAATEREAAALRQDGVGPIMPLCRPCSMPNCRRTPNAPPREGVMHGKIALLPVDLICRLLHEPDYVAALSVPALPVQPQGPPAVVRKGHRL